jgi:hypothetical protein
MHNGVQVDRALSLFALFPVRRMFWSVYSSLYTFLPRIIIFGYANQIGNDCKIVFDLCLKTAGEYFIAFTATQFFVSSGDDFIKIFRLYNDFSSLLLGHVNSFNKLLGTLFFSVIFFYPSMVTQNPSGTVSVDYGQFVWISAPSRIFRKEFGCLPSKYIKSKAAALC